MNQLLNQLLEAQTQMTNKLSELSKPKPISDDLISIHDDEDGEPGNCDDNEEEEEENDEQKDEQKERSEDLSFRPNIIRNKHDIKRSEELKNKRFDTLTLKYKKDSKGEFSSVLSKFDPVEATGNTSSNKSSVKSKPSKKAKKSKKLKNKTNISSTGRGKIKSSGAGGSDSSDSDSNSDDDKFDKITTPKKDKTLKKHKKKDYGSDQVSYLNDQLNPTFEFGDLTDEDDDLKGIEYNSYGIRKNYINNVDFHDQYSFKFDALMEPRYIEKLHLDDEDIIKSLRKDPLMKQYKAVYIKFEGESYPASKIMPIIRAAATRNHNLNKLSTNYLVNFFYGIKSRLFLINKIINPNLIKISDYTKYNLNIRILELNKKIKKYKKAMKTHQKLVTEYNNGGHNNIAYQSIKAYKSLLSYLLYDINKMITLIEYDLKLDFKINRVLKAAYLAVLQDFKLVDNEADKIVKAKKYIKPDVTLTRDSKPTNLLLKLIKSQDDPKKDDKTVPDHVYMTSKDKPFFDPQLGSVKNQIFKPNNNNNNRNNNNRNYNNNNNNYNNNNNNNNRYNNNRQRRNNNNFRKNNNFRNKRNNNNNYYNNNNNNNNRNNYNNNQQRRNNFQNNDNYIRNQNNNNRNFNNNNNNSFGYQPKSTNDNNRFPVGHDDRNFPDKQRRY